MELNLIPRPRSVVFGKGIAAATVMKAIDPTIPAESYRLTAEENGITLIGGSDQGLVWAENTLAQLKYQFPEGVPCLKIEDAPAYPWRAFHIDASRHMRTIDELKTIVDAAGYFKLNTLHWHISDDQGWRIESRAFPKLHELGAFRKGDHFGTYRSDEREDGYYTREEVKEFVAYCESKGIQVVPELDLPGHVSAILHAYPHLSCRGENVEVVTRAAITTEILCAGNEAVYSFLETLIGELLELFPEPWFHIGGDEAPKTRWEACPRCRAKMEQLGLDSHRQLQGYFSGRLVEFLRKHGRRAIMWNDGAYGGGIDPSVVLQVWFPDRDGALDAHIAKGGQVYLSPVVPCYCDYPYGEHPVKAVYELDLKPDYVNRDTVLGGECLTWSEFIRSAERLQELAFPRFTALAEALWSGDDRRSYEDFRTRLEALFPVFAEMGIHATPADLWDPEPEEAKRQSREFRLQFEAESENQDYDALVAAM